jgi:hypothetical protein
LGGFIYGWGSNVFHVPIVLDYARSAEGPADLFTKSLDNFVSGFWWALSLVATESNIFPLFLGIHILLRFLIVFVIWRIANLIGGSSPVTLPLACFLLFFDTFLGDSPVGENEILSPLLSHSQAVVPIVLGSWWLMLRGRYFGAAGLLGLAFNVNAFVAVWAGLAAGVALFIDRRDRDFREVAGTAVVMVGIFALVAVPTAVWIGSTIVEARPYPAFSFRQYLREYYPFHHFIDEQIPDTIRMVLFIFTGFITLNYASAGWSGRSRTVIWSLLCTLSAIFAFGMVLPYVTDMRLLLLLFPLRMDGYVILLLGIVIVAWAASAFAEEDVEQIPYAMIGLFSLANGNVALLLFSIIAAASERRPNSSVWRTWTLGLWIAVMATHLISGQPVSLTVQSSVISVLYLILQGAVVAYFFARNNKSITDSVLFVSVSALGVYPMIDDTLSYLVVAGVYTTAIIYVYGVRPRLLFALLAPSLLAVSSITSLDRIAILIGLLLMLPAAMYAVPFLSRRVFTRIGMNVGGVYVMLAAFAVLGPADMAKRGGLSRTPEDTRNRTEAAQWARRNIPAHSTILTVGIGSFSSLSRRPVWVDSKTGAMVKWAPDSYTTWSSRFAELERVRSVVDAVKLAEREGIDYIVFSKDKVARTRIPERCALFENAGFWIINTCPEAYAGPQD